MKMAKILDLPQSSPQWLAYRRSRITCSDLSVLMGMNPWCSKIQLFNQKIGLEEVIVNQKMIDGSANEKIALAQFNEEMKLDLKPAVFESTEYPWLMASVDGISDDNKILCEIKCGGKSFLQAQKRIIPDYYKCQTQGQLCVLNLDRMYYYAWKGSAICMTIDRDQDFIDKMVEESQKFYDDLINLRAPKDDYDEMMSLNDQEWNERLNKTWEDAIRDHKR